jgi:hypothetical protein
LAKTVRVILDDRKLQEIIRATAGNVKRRIIADGVEYGVFVELGTSRMAARPALVPSFETHTANLGRALGQAVERGVSLDDVMSKTAFDVQRGYQENVPVATGALKNSIHVEEE